METEKVPEVAAPAVVLPPEELVEAKVLIERLLATVAEVAGFADYRNAYKKQFCNLSRRIKLLAPMLEELRESKTPINERAADSLASLGRALEAAKQLLRLGSEGSKIFLVLERDKIMKSFHDVTAQLAQVLGEIDFEEVEISDEIREQVELVHTQFKRAKERVDAPDAELYDDLLSIYNLSADTKVDSSILRGLAEKLQLMTISDLKQESLALHEMVLACGNPGEIIEKMSTLLKRIKDFMQTQSIEMGSPTNSKILPSDETSKIPVIPDDFRCPISLELMGDPVIVSTGQTYERVFIEKWLKAGNETCPKTQQRLSNKSLTPNYVLRSLISQWCETNGMESPKRHARLDKEPIICSAGEHSKVTDLLHKLQSPSLEDQRSASGEIRLLAKRNAENRACIAEAGVIPVLVRLLSTIDVRTQEHAVTALLNLSIYEENKGRIMAAEAVPGIVHVLKRGSMEARENAAATLFSLSVVDRNKVTIGESGAIPPLAMLLREGSQRGKKDAATALFNLCIYQGNKGRAVRAGVIPVLMHILMDPDGAMLDEALAILAMLSSHPEGRASITASQSLPVLVSMIRSASPRNKENAAAVLLHLCNGEQQQQYLTEASEKEVMVLLQEMVEHGTDRGKRKASQLLELINRFLEQQQESQTQAEGISEVQTAQEAITEQPADQTLASPIDE